MMRILVISQPAWANENNSGNTLSNVFSSFNAEFANIYFSEGQPNNALCEQYFQVTDYQLIQHFLRRTKVGNAVHFQEQSENAGLAFEKEAKKHKNAFVLLMREMLWKITRIDTPEMLKFISDFEPNVIYAPSYGNLHMQRIVRRLQERTKLPVISLISDDLYNYHAEDHSFFSHWNKSMLRKSMHKTFQIYSLVYTMTQEQKDEYEKIFQISMKIMRKNSTVIYKTHEFQEPYHMIYAGGLYLGRLDTIQMVSDAIEDINKDSTKIILDIYSNTQLTAEEKERIQKNKQVILHSSISYESLVSEYQKSDIALHVESFTQKYSEYTRLSFSTKIVDCLQSGAAVLAVGPSGNAGISYLNSENAAMCIMDPKKLSAGIQELLNHLSMWQKNAKNCLDKNHNSTINTEAIYNDFQKVINSKKGTGR